MAVLATCRTCRERFESGDRLELECDSCKLAAQVVELGLPEGWKRTGASHCTHTSGATVWFKAATGWHWQLAPVIHSDGVALTRFEAMLAARGLHVHWAVSVDDPACRVCGLPRGAHYAWREP